MEIIPLAAAALVLLSGCSTVGETQYSLDPADPRLSREDAQALLVKKILEAQVHPPLDAPLRLLFVQLPRYPEYVRRREVYGTVVVKFVVNSDGSVSDASLVGQPHPFLSALSLESLLRWKFAPISRGGKPTTQNLAFEFVFELAN